MPNQPPVKDKQSAKKVQQHREQISDQLRINFFRDTLLEISLIFLVQNDTYFSLESDEYSSDMKTLIGCLNEQRFQDVCEERLALKKCLNLWCPNQLTDKNLKMSQSLKFVTGAKGCQKVDG